MTGIYSLGEDHPAAFATATVLLMATVILVDVVHGSAFGPEQGLVRGLLMLAAALLLVPPLWAESLDPFELAYDCMAILGITAVVVALVFNTLGLPMPESPTLANAPALLVILSVIAALLYTAGFAAIVWAVVRIPDFTRNRWGVPE